MAGGFSVNLVFEDKNSNGRTKSGQMKNYSYDKLHKQDQNDSDYS